MHVVKNVATDFVIQLTANLTQLVQMKEVTVPLTVERCFLDWQLWCDKHTKNMIAVNDSDVIIS